MSIIKFDPTQSQRIADFLDSLPDIGQMDADTLKVRIEFAKWALSTNETAEEAKKAAAKKAQEAKAKAKAAKKVK